VRLALAALRQQEPIEDLLFEVFGPAEGRRIIEGRSELLEHRRAEATRAPARRLPADAPAEARGAGPSTRLPLQLERGVRRRLERMRTSEERQALKPIREAAIPAPEQEPSLPQADPAARRKHHGLVERERLRQAAETKPRAPAGEDFDAASMAAEAVRRRRERRRRRAQEEK